jgi:hypothetical protein
MPYRMTTYRSPRPPPPPARGRFDRSFPQSSCGSLI